MHPPRSPAISAQRTDEWLRLDAEALRYHAVQWETPKRSTVAFEAFCAPQLSRSSRVIDMGAGAGASTAYLAERHPNVHFTGFDYSEELIELAAQIARTKGAINLDFLQGDWYDLHLEERYDGVISLQTLSWLPDHEAALTAIFEKIRPEWVALTSLFYDGDITCRVEVDEHQRGRKTFYNVYALPAIARLCAKHGYGLAEATPFVIDVDLPKPPNPDLMGTYTRTVLPQGGEAPERLQISGPLLMNWYMLRMERLSDSNAESGPP